MTKRRVQQGFVGGELSPAMYGRFDDGKYQQGLAMCRNFICLPQGPATNRPGFKFVREVKDSSKKVRLIPFIFSGEQTMCLEFGDKYVRFHTQGMTLLGSNGQPYEVSTPYEEDDLFELEYVQSMDVVTIVHPNYAPRELRRLSANSWSMGVINFSAPLPAPSAPSVSFSYTSLENDGVTDEQKTRYTLKYCVTALRDTDTGYEEGPASGVGSTQGNLYLNDGYCQISWGSVSGAARYRIYKSYKGLYCYIGETTDTSFIDDNYEPDMSITPPIYEDVFSQSGDYPSAVCYFEQRRCFAGSTNKPQMIWMTRSGTETDMSKTIPVQDDNRVKFRIASQEAARILHLVPLTKLMALTGSTEFCINSDNSDAVSPTNISVKPQAFMGASSVKPVIVNSTMVYTAARGGHLRELGYNWQASGYVTGDLSLRAAHLFEDDQVVDITLSKAPEPILWMATKSGKLLGLTYLPEQSVGAWHRHDTTHGWFESVAAVPEGDEDVLYAVVRRVINGQTKRYIERMNERHFDDVSHSVFVDCASTYEGAETTTLSGLNYLEGETVSILANGCVLPQQEVKNGSITLSQASTLVQVGLPITADLQTLPVALQLNDGSYAMGHMKNVNEVWVRVYQSSAIFSGSTFDDMTELKQRTTERYGAPPELVSREVSLVLHPDWNDTGTVCIRQKEPLPLTVVSIAYELAE